MQIDIEKLITQIEESSRLYRLGTPCMSDAEYDALIERLSQLAPEHPWLNRVEPETNEGVFANRVLITHATEMLSTEKARTDLDIQRFAERIAKAAEAVGLDRHEIMYRVTPKLDGLAGRDDGVVLATRGNGQKGYDISHVFALGVIPVGGRGLGLGELVMLNAYFEEFLSDQFEHPRNFMVGLVGADELSEQAKTAIEHKAAHFVPYSQLSNWMGGHEDLLAGIRSIEEQVKADCPYPMDGVVLEVMNPEIRQYLGATHHHHRWQLAIKPQDIEVKTRIISVVWQTGRTGQVTPVLEVDPVKVEGATISRVTAHHAEMVETRGLGPGAQIRIVRSGKVIPKIVGVDEPSLDVHVPKRCPSCGSSLVKDGAFLRCTDADRCSAQKAQSLIHFFSILGNVDLFGPKTIEKLVEAGYVQLPDVYALTEHDFIDLGFGPVQSTNLVRELNRSRAQPIEDWRFLAALGIPNLGRGDSRRLLRHISLHDLDKLTVEALSNIQGFGSTTSQTIVDGIKQRLTTMKYLLDSGFTITYSQTVEAGNDSKIANKNIVFTGKLLSGSRESLEEQARNLGANVQSSVNKKTHYLICGEKVGATKTAKAEQLGVTVISEKDYLDLIA